MMRSKKTNKSVLTVDNVRKAEKFLAKLYPAKNKKKIKVTTKPLTK